MFFIQNNDTCGFLVYPSLPNDSFCIFFTKYPKYKPKVTYNMHFLLNKVKLSFKIAILFKIVFVLQNRDRRIESGSYDPTKMLIFLINIVVIYISTQYSISWTKFNETFLVQTKYKGRNPDRTD